MNRRRIGWMLLGMVGVLVAALVAVELPARAAPPTPAIGAEVAVDVAVADQPPTLLATPASETGGGVPSGLTMPPPPVPTPVEDGGDGGDEGDEGDDGKVTVVERHTIWRILFPYETLKESINAALGEMVAEAARDVGREATEGISDLAPAMLRDSEFTEAISNVRRDGWRVGVVIAGILMPLSFMASVVAAMKDGTSSVTGYASAREALLDWVIAAGAAVSSYFILTKGIELSAVGTGAIFEGLLGTGVNNLDLGAYFMGLVVETGFMSTPGLLQIFLSVFGTLMGLALLASVGLALLAREVILVLAVCIAPVMLILGSLGPLRWLSGMWMKVTVVALLLGPANAFLIGGSALLAQNAHQSAMGLSGTTGRIVGFLVALGIVSVLVGLNSMVGKMVYGAAIEVAEKAWNGIMVVGGAALGVGLGGALGGVGAAATAGGAVGSGAASGAGAAFGEVSQATSAARAVGSIGQAMAAMGLPGGRGLAAGMNAGASVSTHQQIKQGIAQASEARSGRGASEPWESTEFSPPKAVAAAGAGVRGELHEMGERGALGSLHVPLDTARSRASAAEGTVANVMAVGERHKVDMTGGMRQMGVPGRIAQEAGVSYSRAAIRQIAFGSASPYHPISDTLLPKEITVRDLDTAVQIMAHTKPIGAEGVPSVDFLDNLVQTAFHRRVQLSEDPRDTVSDAGRAESLDDWMRGSFDGLPDKGLAAGLRERLGL